MGPWNVEYVPDCKAVVCPPCMVGMGYKQFKITIWVGVTETVVGCVRVKLQKTCGDKALSAALSTPACMTVSDDLC